MKSILEQLARRVREAMDRMGVDGDPFLRVSQDETFGDYQSNCAMGIAKALGRKPHDVAREIVQHLRVDDMCEPAEIAGPGFINFRLKPDFLGRSLGAVPLSGQPDGERLGVDASNDPAVVVVDLSSPNLAKEMHVGHLRSTVIGDCVSRILEFAGHTVHRENHVGDWGTQFGMLVAYLRRVKPEVENHPDDLVLGDLEAFYVDAKQLFDADDDFKTESRETVVALQRGDVSIRHIWKAFCDESLRHCHAIYDRLGVRLVDRGESSYTDLMNEVVRRVEAMKGDGPGAQVRESDGALCMFLEGFKTRDGDPLPFIVRKSDGGFNYATSDLATIIDRVENLKATRIIYVVGVAQKQHFDMLFAAARLAGWVDERVELVHLGFGNMLAPTGRPFKTREGGVVKLKDLLDEAVARARQVVERPTDDAEAADRGFSEEQVSHVAETVGLAAVKYFDLSHALNRDYKFDLDTMLALDGNTAPYMLYAYARVRSIGRKAGVDWSDLPRVDALLLQHPSEIALAKVLLRFAETVDSVSRELRPNVLTDYLYELAKTFSRFYDKKLGVRVIDAPDEASRLSRLHLCDLTARTLQLGLHLLGIVTLEEM